MNLSQVECRWCSRPTSFVLTKLCVTCSELSDLIGRTRPSVLAQILLQHHLGGVYLEEMLAALQRSDIVSTLTDRKRIDWLESDSSRLEDVRGRVNNEGGSIREAIDWLAPSQEVTKS